MILIVIKANADDDADDDDAADDDIVDADDGPSLISTLLLMSPLIYLPSYLISPLMIKTSYIMYPPSNLLLISCTLPFTYPLSRWPVMTLTLTPL